MNYSESIDNDIRLHHSFCLNNSAGTLYVQKATDLIAKSRPHEEVINVLMDAVTTLGGALGEAIKNIEKNISDQCIAENRAKIDPIIEGARRELFAPPASSSSVESDTLSSSNQVSSPPDSPPNEDIDSAKRNVPEDDPPNTPKVARKSIDPLVSSSSKSPLPASPQACIPVPKNVPKKATANHGNKKKDRAPSQAAFDDDQTPTRYSNSPDPEFVVSPQSRNSADGPNEGAQVGVVDEDRSVASNEADGDTLSDDESECSVSSFESNADFDSDSDSDEDEDDGDEIIRAEAKFYRMKSQQTSRLEQGECNVMVAAKLNMYAWVTMIISSVFTDAVLKLSRLKEISTNIVIVLQVVAELNRLYYKSQMAVDLARSQSRVSILRQLDNNDKDGLEEDDDRLLHIKETILRSEDFSAKAVKEKDLQE